jgi:hypothetical protein
MFAAPAVIAKILNRSFPYVLAKTGILSRLGDRRKLFA